MFQKAKYGFPQKIKVGNYNFSADEYLNKIFSENTVIECSRELLFLEDPQDEDKIVEVRLEKHRRRVASGMLAIISLIHRIGVKKGSLRILLGGALNAANCYPGSYKFCENRDGIKAITSITIIDIADPEEIYELFNLRWKDFVEQYNNSNLFTYCLREKIPYETLHY